LLEKNIEFDWTPACDAAWQHIVDALCEKKGVYAPDYDLPLYIRTDACCEGLGAYLFQLVKVKELRKDKEVEVTEERVVEYWSRSVPQPMRNYDARRLELLAVILALEHFKPYIDGVRVLLDTDHRNLTFIKNIKHSSGQLARWAMRLSEYNFELRYRPGKQMEVADCLSRNSMDRELTEEEMEPIMYVANINQVALGPSCQANSNGAVFCVTFGALPQTESQFQARGHSIEQANQSSGENTTGAAHTITENETTIRSTVSSFALPTIDDTQGGESDEEEPAGEPEIDIEEQNLLDEQRVNMQRATTITDEEWEDALETDEMFQQLLEDQEDPKKRPRILEKWKTVDGMLYRRDKHMRKYVPKTLRARVMQMVHDSDYNMHAGGESTLQDLKARFYWTNMDDDVKEYLKRCIWCRKAKTVLPTRAGFLQQTLHQHDGALLSIDLVGPLRVAKGGCNYIFTILDAFSHKLIAAPINSKSATSVLDAFIEHVVLQGLLPSRLVTAFSEDQPVHTLLQGRERRGGRLQETHRKGRIVSDNGKEFKNQLFRTFLKQFATRFGYSIPYHPSSNPVERVHRYVNSLLRIAIDRNDSVYDHWTECLPYITFSYNKKYINGTKISPFMMRNGFQPRYPEDFDRQEYRCKNKTFQQRLEDRIARYQLCEKAIYEANENMKLRNKLSYDQHQYPAEYQVGDKVLLHCKQGIDKLHLRWHGAFEIVE